MMEPAKQFSSALSEAADWRAIEEQLGSPEEATAMSAAVFADSIKGIQSAGQLRDFVAQFQAQILGPQELPIILRSYNHARRSEGREVIQLDRSVKVDDKALAAASVRVGRNQLRRMRALRHEKVVGKYWDAVRGGDASAWHTVVFGVVLAVYSIPLRQGLHHYTQQTVRGFLEAGARTLRLRENEIDEMEVGLTLGTPALVEGALSLNGSGELRCV